jgi:hypothetical protein
LTSVTHICPLAHGCIVLACEPRAEPNAEHQLLRCYGGRWQAGIASEPGNRTRNRTRNRSRNSNSNCNCNSNSNSKTAPLSDFVSSVCVRRGGAGSERRATHAAQPNMQLDSVGGSKCFLVPCLCCRASFWNVQPQELGLSIGRDHNTCATLCWRLVRSHLHHGRVCRI